MEQQPRNKGGRPKGSKNKPKWLKDAQPKRPRGRPKGSKNKPKTLQGFIAEAMAVPVTPPPRKPKNPNMVRPALNAIPPEARIARAKKAQKARKVDRGPACPKGWTLRQYLPLLEEATQEAKRIVKHMVEDGKISADDEIGKEAMTTVLALMRAPGSPEFKLKAARTALEYTKARPTQKSEVTVKTAEDFLDELAEQHGIEG